MNMTKEIQKAKKQLSRGATYSFERAGVHGPPRITFLQANIQVLIKDNPTKNDRKWAEGPTGDSCMLPILYVISAA